MTKFQEFFAYKASTLTDLNSREIEFKKRDGDISDFDTIIKETLHRIYTSSNARFQHKEIQSNPGKKTERFYTYRIYIKNDQGQEEDNYILGFLLRNQIQEPNMEITLKSGTTAEYVITESDYQTINSEHLESILTILFKDLYNKENHSNYPHLF